MKSIKLYEAVKAFKDIKSCNIEIKHEEDIFWSNKKYFSDEKSKEFYSERLNDRVNALRDRIAKSEKKYDKVKGDIIAGLDSVQGKARERLISYSDLEQLIENLDHRFIRFSKASLKGSKLVFSPHGYDFPRAYKYSPMGTVVRLEHDGKGWCITDISREDINGDPRYNIILSETALSNLYKLTCVVSSIETAI